MSLLDIPIRSLLRDSEAAFLEAANVHCAERAYDLLSASPSLEPGGANGNLAIRRSVLMQLLEPAVSAEMLASIHTAAVDPGPVLGGAAAPVPPAVAQPDQWETLDAPSGLGAVPFTTADAQDWPPYDQRTHPTCVAFAAAACVEWMRMNAPGGTYQHLSAHFLYERMSRYPTDHPAQAAASGFRKLEQARAALAQDGICREHTWPDNADPNLEPSQAARDEARAIRIPVAHTADRAIGQGRVPGLAAWIHRELRDRRPVAIALPAYSDRGGLDVPTNWSAPTAIWHGEIADPVLSTQKQTPDSGHAVCVVGYRPAPGTRAGGYFIFRNSRGRAFGQGFRGDDEPWFSPGEGYGTISAWHVENFVWEYLSLELP